MFGRGIEQDADDVILHAAKRLGTPSSVTVLQQLRLCGFAGLRQFTLQQLGNRRTEHVVPAAVFLGKRVDRRHNARGIEDQFGIWREFGCRAVHPIRITDGSDGVISGIWGGRSLRGYFLIDECQ